MLFLIEFKVNYRRYTSFATLHKILIHYLKEQRRVKQKNKQIELFHKLVFTYSDKRALKDQKERTNSINKLMKKIQENRVKGREKYLKKYCDGEKVVYNLDLEKIEQDKKYDGFYAIACSDMSLPPLKIIKIHKQISHIEKAFRELKTDLNIRPIYHYKPERIRGHIIVSFLAYFLLKHMERRLRYNQKTQEMVITPLRIIKALKTINAIETDIGGKKYYLKSKHTQLASKLFEIFKVKTMRHIMSLEDMKKYLLESSPTPL